MFDREYRLSLVFNSLIEIAYLSPGLGTILMRRNWDGLYQWTEFDGSLSVNALHLTTLPEIQIDTA